MKKIIVGFVALLVTLLVSAQAVTTNDVGQIIETYTNGLGQVFETVVGQVGTTEVPVAVPRPQMVLLDRATVVDATDYTPSGIGQILIGITSNKVFVSTGVTTNDWAAVN